MEQILSLVSVAAANSAEPLLQMVTLLHSNWPSASWKVEFRMQEVHGVVELKSASTVPGKQRLLELSHDAAVLDGK